MCLGREQVRMTLERPERTIERRRPRPSTGRVNNCDLHDATGISIACPGLSAGGLAAVSARQARLRGRRFEPGRVDIAVSLVGFRPNLRDYAPQEGRR